FTAADGTMQTVQMMNSAEHSYLQDSLATGFIKEYENGYRFVALLPNEGISMEDYLASLTGAGLLNTIENSRNTRVSVSMPMLEAETSLSLKEVLTAMGMELPFSSMADFSAMGQGDLYLSEVLHKTSLKIDEQGTQAGASTSVIVTEKSASRSLSVVLNRPYVMAIMDGQTGTILFMGVVNQIP
ncbi:MAG: serine protease, partial [Oscillospiraceae bacterium]|nr:serine protease [Oscillospiraceae bacterium]